MVAKPKAKIPSPKKKEAKPKGRPGRKPFEPTPAQRRTVEIMRVAGISEEVMARCLGLDGIDPKTLRKYFREELDLAKAKVDARIVDTHVRQALAGNTALIIWYEKAFMGMRERSVVEQVGRDGGPIESTVKLDLGALSDEALDKLAEVSALLGQDGQS